jgi:Caspase domain
MASDDWAIVVGVWLYPGLQDLGGPENDAVAFVEWLKSSAGGDVPESHMTLILSSQCSPPFGSADTARPTRDAIEKAFDVLNAIAQNNSTKLKGLRVGRRLYLYFGGHGFSPVKDESALLAANSTAQNLRYHIPGRAWAEWFHTANYFDEIVLFMDCCRSTDRNWPVNPVGWSTVIGPKQGFRFFCFGTKWRKVSWERPMQDGKVHGVFTTALLTGLKGGAADPETGLVTAKTLQSYLYNYMKDFFAPDLRGLVPQEPEVLDLDNAGNNLVFAKLDPPRFTVTIHPHPSAVGKKIAILDANFYVVESTTMPLDGVINWTVNLKRGRYLPTIDGNIQGEPFDVSGTEPDPPGKQVDVGA